jgi:hypothetical protein
MSMPPALPSVLPTEKQTGLSRLFFLILHTGTICIRCRTFCAGASAGDHCRAGRLPFLFIGTLVHPLRVLTRGVHRVDQGELDTHIPVMQEDEIGSITHAFNRLSRNTAENGQRDFEQYR